METIHTRGRNIEIPTCVDELTPGQYEYFCFMAFMVAGCMYTAHYLRVRWLSFLIGMKKVDYTILKPEFVAELDAQLDAVNGFFDISADIPRLRIDTVRNLMPVFKGHKGPGDMLQGVTWGEFTECFTVAGGINGTTPEESAESCRHIARILYHIPESKPVPELLAFHAPRLFANVWHAIQSGPIEINGQKIDFRIIFKSAGNTKPDDRTGWTGITFEVASAGLFGNVEQVERTDMWAVLIYLYRCKFEYLNEKRNT